jgi:hypothetical protein
MAAPQVSGRCMSRAAMRCATSCDPLGCMQPRQTCQPLDAAVCSPASLTALQNQQYGNDPRQIAAACTATSLCSALTSSAGITPDAACSATYLAQCPGDNCNSCKAQVAQLLADVAAAPVSQCKGGEENRPNKQRLCMRTVAGMVEAGQACTEVAAMFPLWKTNAEALGGAGNFTEFCSKMSGGEQQAIVQLCLFGAAPVMLLMAGVISRLHAVVAPALDAACAPKLTLWL